MARQHNEQVNLEDCMNHLLYMSDPVIRSQGPNYSDEDVEKELYEFSEDDVIFNSLIIPNEIEE